MPSYAPNFTARLRVKYRAGLGVHTQTWRFLAGVDVLVQLDIAKAAVAAIWGHLTDILFDDTQCLAVTYATAGSNIFLPSDAITIGGGVTTPTDNPSIKADAVSLVGRTAGGQPAKEFFYGIDRTAIESGADRNYRITPGESFPIDGAIAEANGFLIPLSLCGSDGLGISWYPYANVKPNDYWVKRLRQGS